MIVSPDFWRRAALGFVGRSVRVKYESEALGKGEVDCELVHVGEESIHVTTQDGAQRVVKFSSLRGLEAL